MTVSLCIIARNEERAISGLLEQIKLQSYLKKNIELVFVDSDSEDNTKQIFLSFAQENKESYINIQVLDNIKGNQASGWNTAIKNAVGDIIIRLDAHAEIPTDFIQKNVELIKSGEDVCGGARPNKIDCPTPFKEMLFLAESSMFGSSIAGYRRKSEDKKYVSSLFHGAYRREVFAKVGGFNRNLGRTEDNELHYRIRQAGYKICQGSEIISYQHIRNTLSGMLAQKYGNGKWIGLTLGVCYQCLSAFHFVPFMFVFMLMCSGIVAIAGMYFGLSVMALPFFALMALYLLADLVMTIIAIISAPKKHIIQIILPVIFFLLHISYGIGTFAGVLKLPFWKLSLDDLAQKEIEDVKKCVRENTRINLKEEENGTDNDKW